MIAKRDQRKLRVESGWHFRRYQKKSKKPKNKKTILHLGKGRKKRKDRFSFKKNRHNSISYCGEDST
jgi:hypothetical protein